jgi:hypothetical protein
MLEQLMALVFQTITRKTWLSFAKRNNTNSRRVYQSYATMFTGSDNFMHIEKYKQIRAQFKITFLFANEDVIEKFREIEI